MSRTQGEKLRLIRNSEQMTKRELADLTGLNYATYHGYESDKSKMTFESGVKIFAVKRFRKYRDWFMFDEVNPEAGQIAPALAHTGHENTESSPSDKKTG
ncbi:helix-turn-helix transcriptional regulator [Providencia sp. wls1950]|uniref:helix-turn-helix transcriptional regulator n=1 Tax=Providencia sp. wls1950 TaxID=2675147 RepID=UPI0012B63CD5|nr:helix-turn-helix transcriptional regulator [Providencia sp. wls1950]MTB46211.1 XRE family transcriptional regulator [Providencia sp. wls1950]